MTPSGRRQRYVRAGATERMHAIAAEFAEIDLAVHEFPEGTKTAADAAEAVASAAPSEARETLGWSIHGAGLMWAATF